MGEIIDHFFIEKINNKVASTVYLPSSWDPFERTYEIKLEI